jgi:hypothetical protein
VRKSEVGAEVHYSETAFDAGLRKSIRVMFEQYESEQSLGLWAQGFDNDATVRLGELCFERRWRIVELCGEVFNDGVFPICGELHTDG